MTDKHLCKPWPCIYLESLGKSGLYVVVFNFRYNPEL